MEWRILNACALVLIALTSTACLRSGAFHCATDTDCGPGGQCEPTTFCSFAAADCDRRYGEASGPFSNRCVAESGGDGGMIDAPDATGGDAPTDMGIDAMPTCTDMTVLVGTSDHSGGVTDSIPNNIADAFGYTTPAGATGRCAWVWVGGAPSGDIRVGVYSDSSSSPTNLLAQVRIPHPSGGNRWVSGLLDSQVTLATNQVVWLALITTAGTLSTPLQSSCGNGQFALHNDTNLTAALPDPFNVAQTFTSCAAAIFLGP